MYKYRKPTQTSLKVNKQYEGESMEEKIRRITEFKEPITDVAEKIYTERKDGVIPEYDIRHDHWDDAIESHTAASKQYLEERAKRHNPSLGEEAKENMAKETKTETNPGGKETGGQSTAATE